MAMPHDARVLTWLQAVRRPDHHQMVVMSAAAQAKDLRILLEAGTIAAFLPKSFALDCGRAPGVGGGCLAANALLRGFGPPAPNSSD
jgi:hypothetical protein